MKKRGSIQENRKNTDSTENKPENNKIPSKTYKRVKNSSLSSTNKTNSSTSLLQSFSNIIKSSGHSPMYQSSMGTAEREKLLGNDQNHSSTHESKHHTSGLFGMIARQSQNNKARQWIIFAISALVLFLLFKPSTNHDYKYGIMFDAGSTGSRIHVYKFHEGKGGLKLDDELFEQVKPGLSSYPDDITGATASIKGLIDLAMAYIPKEKHSSTPLALKASAGLRILGEEKAVPILNGVKKMLDQQPFQQKWVPEIMDGTKEAVYSWMTLNYLADSLTKSGASASDTFGTLDLGGGSTQIAFAPSDPSTKSNADASNMLKETAFGKEWEVYIHSYLGLGLMSAREAMLDGPHEGDNKDVSSVCHASGFSEKWDNARSGYSVNGAGADFTSCYAKAKGVVAKMNVDSPNEIRSQTFYAFSYYFDRAVEVGLISGDGGEVTVLQFKQAAETACRSVKKTENGEWLCMDLSIISALLGEGFKFHDETTLRLYKKINGIETQWSLGATFALFAAQ